ncbi:GIY-YIG nuclease family protein [Streptomyces sp. NPDC047117]|uniref:GIY-YIG nuclease family protein n=1 Tax=Streptomyces sp. NPDC047117 TaxID=3155379 RepID=UPI0033F486CF
MKTTSKRRERLVPLTIDGKTHQVPDPYDVQVTVPPRDWDAIVLRAVMAATLLVVLGAVTWSTTGIGGLLDRAAPTWVSYLIAGVFDLAWVVSMAIEWLSRYDRRRARLPKWAGWAALAVSMAAIFVQHWLSGSVWVGAFGALVSLIAKGMWAVTQHHTAKELDPQTLAWVQAETSEVNARLAMTAVRRQLARSEARIRDEQLALAPQQSATIVGQARAPEPVTVPVHIPPVKVRPEPVLDVPGPGTVEDGREMFKDRHHSHPDVVYFALNGSRVKIGTTIKLRKRMERLSLRMSDVVRIEYGGRDHERSLHRRFAQYRVDQTEWFEVTGELAAYLGVGESEHVLVADEQPSEQPEHVLVAVGGETGIKTAAPPLTGHEQRSSLAELAREQLASGASKEEAADQILKVLPTAKPESVKAEVRRQARKLPGGYL